MYASQGCGARLVGAVVALVPLFLAACHAESPDLASKRGFTATAAASTPPPQPPQPSVDPPGRWRSAAVPGSDGTLAAMVESALLAEPDLHAAAIDVSAVEGTVYLRGQARDRATRRLATQIAHGVDGVKRVQNELFVTTAGS